MPNKSNMPMQVTSIPRYMSRFDESLAPNQNASQYESELFMGPNNMMFTPAAVRSTMEGNPANVSNANWRPGFSDYASMWNQYISTLPQQGQVSQANPPMAMVGADGWMSVDYRMPKRMQYVPAAGYMPAVNADYMESYEYIDPIETWNEDIAPTLYYPLEQLPR